VIYPLYTIVAIICIYTVRHYWFTLNRLFGFQRHPYIDTDTAEWPPVTILVAAHNEEKVVANILGALMTVKYPEDKMLIIPVNDRSTDRNPNASQLLPGHSGGCVGRQRRGLR